MSRLIAVLCLTVFATVFAAPPTAAQERPWPEVQGVDVSVGFDTSADRFDLVIPIFSAAGEPVYWFICRGGDEEYLDRLFEETGVNYVGPLLCRLDTERREREFTLLAHDESPIWHTRGHFSFGELVGACGKYPEYGRLRHFRLRGFKLTLKVEDPVIESGAVEYFLVNVAVRQDTAAASAFAEQPGFLDPAVQGVPPQPRSCERVLSGEGVRMCRDPETLSWAPCELQ